MCPIFRFWMYENEYGEWKYYVYFENSLRKNTFLCCKNVADLESRSYTKKICLMVSVETRLLNLIVKKSHFVNLSDEQTGWIGQWLFTGNRVVSTLYLETSSVCRACIVLLLQNLKATINYYIRKTTLSKYLNLYC